MNKNILIAVVAFVVIGGALWYTKASSPVSQAPVTPDKTVEVAPKTSNTEEVVTVPAAFTKFGANAIYVAEQRSGKEIIVNLVSMESPGYITIQESVDGRPGEIIGASSLVKSGAHKNVKVTLSREAVAGEKFIAMLYKETSGTGFNSGDDAPLRDADENIVFMNFEVSVSAPDPRTAEVMF